MLELILLKKCRILKYIVRFMNLNLKPLITGEAVILIPSDLWTSWFKCLHEVKTIEFNGFACIHHCYLQRRWKHLWKPIDTIYKRENIESTFNLSETPKLHREINVLLWTQLRQNPHQCLVNQQPTAPWSKANQSLDIPEHPSHENKLWKLIEMNELIDGNKLMAP